MVLARATTAVVFLMAVLSALGGIPGPDIQRPTQGYRFGDPSRGIDVVIPLSIAQCQPTLIYYNISTSYAHGAYFSLKTPDGYDFLFLYLLPGIGYLDWVCNIPTGYSFVAADQYYTVQPGSSDACLGDLTTTYDYASYFTTEFQSYTQHPASGNSSLATADQHSVITAFPTDSYPTINANPDLVITSTTPTSSTSFSIPTPSPSGYPSASPHKSKNAIIAGGVIGGVTLVLLTIAITFIILWKRRNSPSDVVLEFPTVDSEPPYSGLMATQPGLTVPLLQSSGRGRYLSHTDSVDTVHGRNESMLNATQTACSYVPNHSGVLTSYSSDTAAAEFSPSASVAPPAPYRPEEIVLSYHPSERSTSEYMDPRADLALAFDVTRRLTASQRQTLIASWYNPAYPTTTKASLQQPPTAASADVQLSTARPILPMSETTQEGLPDIATNILGVISRARLGPTERHALVRSLSTLLIPGQATHAEVTSGNPLS